MDGNDALHDKMREAHVCQFVPRNHRHLRFDSIIGSRAYWLALQVKFHCKVTLELYHSALSALAPQLLECEYSIRRGVLTNFVVIS